MKVLLIDVYNYNKGGAEMSKYPCAAFACYG